MSIFFVLQYVQQGVHVNTESQTIAFPLRSNALRRSYLPHQQPDYRATALSDKFYLFLWQDRILDVQQGVHVNTESQTTAFPLRSNTLRRSYLPHQQPDYRATALF